MLSRELRPLSHHVLYWPRGVQKEVTAPPWPFPHKTDKWPLPLFSGMGRELTMSSTNYFVLPMEKRLYSYKGVINFISQNVSVSFAEMMIYYLDNLYISKGL